VFCRQNCRIFFARNMGSTADTLIGLPCQASDAGSISATVLGALFSTRSAVGCGVVPAPAHR